MREPIKLKETKISMLVHNYELFKMEENEPICDMFTRFTNIVLEKYILLPKM